MLMSSGFFRGQARVFGVALVTLTTGIVGTLIVQKVRAAGIPATGALTYAGNLALADGTAVTGSRYIAMAIYDAPSAGTRVCDAPSASVAITAGRFELLLPDACTAAVKANKDLWVEIQVEGAPLQRTKLGAVPFAVEAGNATTAASASHAMSADSAATAASATRATNADSTPWSGLAGTPANILAIGTGAIQVDANNKVGIGTASPQGRFTVADTSTTDPNGLPASTLFLGHVHVSNGWDATGICAMGTSGSDVCMAANGGTWHWGYQTNPTTMTTTMSLQSNGNLTIGGTLTQSSSAAFKKDIHFLDDHELDQILSTVQSTPIATYRYKSAAPESKVNYGVIAEKTPGMLLNENDQGVNLSNTIGALLASVKAQQAHIARLEKRISTLESGCRR